MARNRAGEHVCNPARCLIRGRNFYVLKPDGYASYWQNEVDETLLAELRRLGVADAESAEDEGDADRAAYLDGLAQRLRRLPKAELMLLCLWATR